MHNGSRIYLALKALRELGPRQLGLYAWYRFLLRSGYLRKQTTAAEGSRSAGDRRPSAVMLLPSGEELLLVIGDENLSQLLAEADEIVAGQVRLFGDDTVPLLLTPPGELSHWTEYELGRQPWGVEDPKFIWEPARFGWAFTLGRAYHLSGNERYSESFWHYFEIFQEANPVNMGQNWTSAQEVALRLIAFVFAAQIFSKSHHSTATRNSQLANSIAYHAARIPPSLIYARAQNNNHLLSEAAGLITASLALPDHPDSPRWSKLGWKWFNRGLETQIAEDGAYMQHSTNYHRLMLQLVLWIRAIQRKNESAKGQIGKRAICNVQRATQWLLSLTDLESGRVPNLGPNDGAYILPLTMLPFHDYRPVLQAASQAFLGESAFDPGAWDEMVLWLVPNSGVSTLHAQHANAVKTSPYVLRNPHGESWAYLRVAKFDDRPGHADQLHLDLWWHGFNVAQDAGTYLYNADHPWNNALTHTSVHNTVMIDGDEQMTRVGRFLYLDWAQAEIVAREQAEDGSWKKLVARHDGYLQSGVIHNRSVCAQKDGRWVIEDLIQPVTEAQRAIHTLRLHWLLPDWAYELSNSELGIRIQSLNGWVSLSTKVLVGEHVQPAACKVQLTRAGEVLYGDEPAHPTWGWVSPTYGQKIPALSFSVIAGSSLPITFTSEWIFPTDEQPQRNP